MSSHDENSYTSYTSASEDIGSEDTPEELRGDELSSSSSATTATTSSSASSPRRSPRLAEKRSRILEKEGVTFRQKRRRHGTGPPHVIIVPVASLPHPRAAGPPVAGGLFTHSPPHVPTVRIPVWPSPPPSSPSPSEASTSSMGKRSSSEVESSSDSEAKRPRQIPPRGLPPPPRPLPPQRAPPRQYPPPPLPSPTRKRFGPWRRIKPFALFKNEPLFGPAWQPRYFDACPESFATSGVKIPRATARRKATRRSTSPPPPPSPLLPEYSPDSSRSGESYSGRYSPSLPSSRGSSPASPPPSPSAGRTTRSGRFYPYAKPASYAKRRLEETCYETRASKDLLIPTTTFARLGRGVLAEVAPEKKYHFAGAALKVLQRATEDIAISSLAVAYDFAKHRNGIELKQKDFKLFHRIYKGSYPYF
ncbi:hypothetical protein CDAR_204181 [Caerostris darwini]|uniref:Uncharacterized protein n=1 Tax=Caerostris darwini TaxID=1538125 RepID=A0AAV4T4K0_9ARAC|nr:hypothetical protein CDAR_204181 [Caerostris darwini]